jgi:HEAT repeat protein
MGLFDFLGGGTPAEKAQKLKAKATQKYGDAAARQKALQQLIDLKHPDAVPVLLQRFTLNVDPQTTDAEEKEHVFEAIVGLGEAAVAPVTAFLSKSDAASSWAVKLLAALLPEDKLLGVITAELARLGASYTRDPEKKEVLLHSLEGKRDERIGPAVLPFVHDMSDEVKIAALKTLASLQYAPAREAILELLTGDETARRVQTACVAALVEAGFEVTGFREKVEARLPDGYFIEKSGLVKKRGG